MTSPKTSMFLCSVGSALSYLRGSGKLSRLHHHCRDCRTQHIMKHRLDQKQKEMQQQKDELLKQSKAQAVTMENVKSQIDILVKVRFNLDILVFAACAHSTMTTTQTATDVQKKVHDLAETIPTTIS